MVTHIASIGDMIIPLVRYPHLLEGDPIGDGVALLLQNVSADGLHLHYDELLVVNDKQQLVGHLSVVNILSSFFPTLLSASSVPGYAGKKERFTDLSILLEDSFRKECRRQAEKTVGEFMSSPRRIIDAAWHPLHAAEVMIKEQLGSLPVAEDGRLLGAVRLTDLFRVLGAYCTL